MLYLVAAVGTMASVGCSDVVFTAALRLPLLGHPPFNSSNSFHLFDELLPLSIPRLTRLSRGCHNGFGGCWVQHHLITHGTSPSDHACSNLVASPHSCKRYR